LAAWLVSGGLSGSFGPVDAEPVSSPPDRSSGTYRLAGFPAPEQDLAADRLHERVNGAADSLRDLGCERLLYWKLGEPAADLELLAFDDVEGAGKALDRDVGPGRDTGPGDECSVGDNAIFFRRGRLYVRVIADPWASVSPDDLLTLARRVDRAIAERTGGLR
jgi:hypothetical protein